MKKLMKKIKSNSFISKAVALLTICMVLMSSLTVSSFAAEEEASAANEETDSITDVWTSVMNWITTSLGSVQGVFFGESGAFPLEYGSVIEVAGLPFYPILNFPDANVGDVISFYVVEETGTVYDELDITDTDTSTIIAGVSASKYAILTIPEGSLVVAYFDPVLNGDTYQGWYSMEELPLILSGSSDLTFLGTLAVIGVAIAIAFLLLSVISRFLRLRG